jgi:hypothetical protein
MSIINIQNNNKVKCQCGYLHFLSKDPYSRVILDKNNLYYFKLNIENTQLIKFCTECGGNDILELYNEWKSNHFSKCNCNLLHKLAENENIPIFFDKDERLYFMKIDYPDDEGYFRFLYCF